MEILVTMSGYSLSELKEMQSLIYKEYARKVDEFKSKTNGKVSVPFDYKYDSRSKRKNSKSYYFHSINGMISTINNIDVKLKKLDYLSSDEGKAYKERLEIERDELQDKMRKYSEEINLTMADVLSDIACAECGVTNVSDDLEGNLRYFSINVFGRRIDCICDNQEWRISLYSETLVMDSDNRQESIEFYRFMVRLNKEWEVILGKLNNSVSELLSLRYDAYVEYDKVMEKLKQ